MDMEPIKYKEIYTCPMHPEIKNDKPGICPECGMNLVKKRIKTEGHHNHEMKNMPDKHTGHKTSDFLKKFWISFILTVPTVAYSGILNSLFKIQPPAFFGSQYLPFILGSIVFFYGGLVFLRGAKIEIEGRSPGMMTLIAIAIISGYLWSVYSTIFNVPGNLFWEITTLITIMLLGHWFEMKSVVEAEGALRELSKLLPDTADLLITPNSLETKKVPLSELRVGSLVLVRPGGKIPADGKVIEGQSEINESMVTGESKPVLKLIGSNVIAGTINSDGSLKIEVSKIGEDTFLSGIMRLIKEAQASKSKLQLLSDRAAFYLTIIALSVGGISFIVWLILKGNVSFAFERFVSVLVITCPHALGLAVPLVVAISTTMAVQNGFLVKKRVALETARKINIVLFDKTGTLTKGEYGVTNITVNSKIAGIDEDEVLKLAASLDAYSEHSISKAIVGEAHKRNIQLYKIGDFRRISGKGVAGKLPDGKEISAGGENMIREIKNEIDANNQKNETVIYVTESGRIIGAIALADIIRSESKEAIKKLEIIGVKVAMITGDSEDTAKWVAQELGISEYFAKVLPEEKAIKVKLLQEKGYKVAMVGDGINDAPALTQADVGIAIGAGTNVAIESAGIILIGNDPREISKVINLSRRTFSKMIQNIFWATGYNVVTIPLAAGILYSKGILLQPATGAVLMSLSTVIVVFNAMLLKRIKLN